jgi:hypothetical protein
VLGQVADVMYHELLHFGFEEFFDADFVPEVFLVGVEFALVVHAAGEDAVAEYLPAALGVVRVGVEQVADEHVGALQVVHAGLGVVVGQVATLLQDGVTLFVLRQHIAVGYKAVF